MAAISDGEKNWILEGIQVDVRNDGRKCQDFREAQLQLGLVTSAAGSARVRVGGNDVIVGVKVDLGTPDAERPDCGQVQIATECSPCAGPRYLGRAGEDLASEVAQALQRSMTTGLSGSGPGLDLTKLVIISGKQCWVVYVDVVLLAVEANVVDTVSLAVKAALADTKLPAVEVLYGEGGEGDPELELSDDPAAGTRLDTAAVPVIVTVSKIGDSTVVDLTDQEAACSSSSLQAAVLGEGAICGVTQRGDAALDPASLPAMLSAAQVLGREMHGVLDQYLSTKLRT